MINEKVKFLGDFPTASAHFAATVAATRSKLNVCVWGF